MNKGRKWLALILAATMTFSFGVFSAQADEAEDALPEKGTVVHISRGMTDAYSALLATTIQADFQEDHPGWTYSIQDCDNSAAKEVELLENAISQMVDVIVLETCSDASVQNYVEEAMANDIKVIAINLWMEDEGVCPYMMSDYYTAMKTVCDYAQDAIPENAKAVVLQAIEGFYPNNERYRAITDMLETRSDIEVLDTQFAQYNKDTAMSLMEDWLQMYPDIDVVLSLNDSMALGAIEAYKANKLDPTEIQFYGVDALMDCCKSIKEGGMTASAFQDPKYYSEAIEDMLQEWYAGTLDTSVIVPLSTTLVTADNVDEIIEIQEAD